MNSRFFLPLLFLLLQAPLASSQTDTTTYWEPIAEFDVGFLGASPLNNFRRNVDQELYGVRSSLLFAINSAPSIFIGGDFFFLPFARVRAEYGLNYNGFIEIYDVRSRTAVLGIHAKIKIAPAGYRKWQPFAELMVGTKYLGTRSAVYSYFPETNEYERADRFLQQTAWALSYGGFVGVNRLVYSYFDTDIRAFLKVGYLPGSGAEYLILPENYQLGTNPEDPYDEKFSTTDLLLVEIGVTFAFGKERSE